ncbi:hypothetical protein ABT150_51175 [Streptomyces mirabilis]|uniref:hypothetical protein n=1 Tax=Streptomyces mirabilis TaxID=68239 RepID=UPI003319BAF8
MYTVDEVRRQPLSADPRQLRDAAVYPDSPNSAGLFDAILKAEQKEVRRRRHWLMRLHVTAESGLQTP